MPRGPPARLTTTQQHPGAVTRDQHLAFQPTHRQWPRTAAPAATPTPAPPLPTTMVRETSPTAGPPTPGSPRPTPTPNGSSSQLTASNETQPTTAKQQHSQGTDQLCTSDTVSITHIDFPLIAHWCADGKPTEYNLSPAHLQSHRQEHWPDMANNAHPQIRYIYQAVKTTGLPNCMQARIPLDTEINVSEWRARMDGSKEEAELIDFIEFGFPIGYYGPTVHTPDPTNHVSADQFPEHIQEFIDQELSHGALYGPYRKPLFTQWQHVSPMMTRPKADPNKRRIISDLSYPRDNSVNAYIKKNCSMGRNHDHSLPTVKAVVDEIKRVGKGVTLFTIDIHRAYKNFRACPLDWPLLNIMWTGPDGGQDIYLDTAMPFGSKHSSLHFQRIANFIVRLLAAEGIKSYMYLDDLIVIAPDPITAYYQYDKVRDLFRTLGLPEAPGKTQPPSHKVTFLGIQIDTRSMTLSIPQQKVDQTLTEIKKIKRRKHITRRQLQSIVGRIIHVAKCVAPARLFAARLLDALRGPQKVSYIVDQAIRADLDWFINYLRQWNGIAYIPAPQVSATIYTDACMTGIGATDGTRAYAAAIAPENTNDYHITEIEGFNVLLACDAFLDHSNKGTTVLIRCDNKPAVDVFSTGRGRNPVLLDTARKLWYLQAMYHINLIFVHIPGRLNQVADILSRAFVTPLDHHKAMQLIAQKGYRLCKPRTQLVNDIPPL